MNNKDLMTTDWTCLEWLMEQHAVAALAPCTQLQLERLRQLGYVERCEQTVLPGIAAKYHYQLSEQAKVLLMARKQERAR